MNNFIFFIVLVILFIFILYIIVPKKDDVDTEPMLQKIRENFAKIHPSFAKIPLFGGNSAYTDNKSKITLCLNDPKNGRKYSLDVLMYVALHELTHCVCKSFGHGAEFQEKFSQMLKKATALKIYDPHQKMPSDYCGIKN